MSPPQRVVTVFGSSRPRAGDAAYAEARALGNALAAKGFAVCSGGYGGVMEAVSRGAKEAEGRVLAVTAEFFRAKANRWVDQEIRVTTWQDRLFELIRRGDAYVVCAGGTGTLVELAVVWEMINKGVISVKPCVVLGDFWQPVIARVREIEAHPASQWNDARVPVLHVAATPEEAAEHLAARLLRS